MFVAYQVFFDYDLATVDAAAHRLFILDRYCVPLVARRTMLSLGSVNYIFTFEGDDYGAFRFRTLREFTQAEILAPDQMKGRDDFESFFHDFRYMLYYQLNIDYAEAEKMVLEERKMSEELSKLDQDPKSVQRRTEDLITNFKTSGRNKTSANKWLQQQLEAGRDIDDIMIDEYIEEMKKDPRMTAHNRSSRKLIRKRMLEFKRRWERRKL